MRVFSYERCSLDEQTNSIDTQHQLIKKYCHLKDLELTGSFVDFGISGGGIKKRVEYQKMVDMVIDGKVDTIICSSLSRLSRNTLDLLNLVQLLQVNNVQLVVIKENIDLSTPMGKFFVSILGSIYDLERNLISDRTKDVLQYKKHKNIVYTNNTPYGFDKVGNELVENPVEQRLIKKVNTLRYKKKESYGNIVKFLNRNNYKTKKGQDFNKNNVVSLLKNHSFVDINRGF